MFGMRKDIFDKLIDSDRNLIVSGDISSGKTGNIIFPIIDRLVTNGDGNYLFLDSKEEYINKYYGYLKSNDYNIIIINLQESDRSDGFNPLYYPYRLYKSGMTDEAVEYLESVASSIFLEKNGDSSFWNLSACDLFIGLSLILFKEAEEKEINISSVNALLDSNELKKYVDKLEKTSPIYTCVSGTLLAPNDTKSSIISTFRQQLRKIISKDKLINMLSGTTFDVDRLANDKNAIFIISRDDNREANVVSSVVIEQIFKIVFDNNLHYRFNMILDNIDTIDNVNNLSGMMSSGISRNIKFIIGTRSLELFDNKYGEYINKLSNIISINDKNMEVMIDNKYNKIRYRMSSYELPKDTINYPIMKNNDIKIFVLGGKKVSKDQNHNDTFISVNPFINKQDDNIFSVYQDTRNTVGIDDVDSDKDSFDIDEVAINKEIEEDENKDIDVDEKIDKDTDIDKLELFFDDMDDNFDIDDDVDELESISNDIEDNFRLDEITLDKETKLDKINKKILEVEELSLVKDEDAFNNDNVSTTELLKLIDDKFLSIENEDDDNAQNEFDDSMFNYDSFPSIKKKNYNEGKKSKTRVKNRLRHYKDRDKINEKVEKELEKLGFIKVIDGDKCYMNGYNKMRNKLLREKYNIYSGKNNIFN